MNSIVEARSTRVDAKGILGGLLNDLLDKTNHEMKFLQNGNMVSVRTEAITPQTAQAMAKALNDLCETTKRANGEGIEGVEPISATPVTFHALGDRVIARTTNSNAVQAAVTLNSTMGLMRMQLQLESEFMIDMPDSITVQELQSFRQSLVRDGHTR